MHIDDRSVFVVVGVSRNREKYGYRVWKSLVGAGFETVAVNPACGEVDGVCCYESVSAVLADKAYQERIDDVMVVTVVPPAITEQIVEECKRLGIFRIWMQPGSESEAVLRAGNEAMEIQSGACLVVDRLKMVLSK